MFRIRNCRTGIHTCRLGNGPILLKRSREEKRRKNVRIMIRLDGPDADLFIAQTPHFHFSPDGKSGKKSGDVLIMG